MNKLKNLIEKEWKAKFPIRPSLEDPDRMVIYSRNEWGLMEAEEQDFKEFIYQIAEKYAKLKVEEAEKEFNRLWVDHIENGAIDPTTIILTSGVWDIIKLK